MGTLYYERCKAIASEIEAADNLATLMQGGVGGTLRVSTSVAFGRRVLVPLAMRYMREHPELTIDLSFEDRYVNLVEQGIDLAIRMGRLADSSLGARVSSAMSALTQLAVDPASSARRNSAIAAVTAALVVMGAATAFGIAITGSSTYKQRYGDTGAQVAVGVGMALAAVAEDGDLLAGDQVDVAIGGRFRLHRADHVVDRRWGSG